MQFLELTTVRRDVTKMLWALVSGLVLLVAAQTVASVSLELDTPNCQVSLDPVFDGNLTDCSDWDLSNVSRLHGLPQNTTTLVLDRTNIGRLHKNYFRDGNLDSLRNLSVRASSLSTIEVDALSGLSGLQILDLEYNSLPFCDKTAFPPGMFHHVPNLSHLFIGFNILYTDVSSDCRTYENNIDIFSTLPNLTHLSIDAVSGTLDLGEQFSSLTHLTNLTVVCNKVSYISNSSLRALKRLPLEVLNLVALHRNDVPLEAGVFQDLPSLQFLSMGGIHVSNHGILQALQPFVNRSMEAITLFRTNKFQTFNIPSTIFNDGLIGENARFLTSICVRHFSWIDSLLFAIKPNTLTGGLWRTCLQTLDLSQNKLENTGWLSDIFEMIRLKYLTEFTMSSISSPSSEDIPRLVHFRLSDLTNGREGARVRGQIETVNNNEVRDHRETVNNNEVRDLRETVNNDEDRDPRETVNNDEVRDLRETVKNDEVRDLRETVKNDEVRDLRETVNNNEVRDHRETVDSEKVSSSTKRGSGLFFSRLHNKLAHRAERPHQRTMTSRAGHTDHFPETMTFRGGHTDLLSEIMTSIGGRSDDFPEGQAARQTGHKPDDFHFHFPYNGNITMYLPASLERLKVINIIFAGITLEYWTVVVARSNRLKQLYWINNDLLRAKGAIYGLETLQVLGLSGSRLDIANHIMDTFLGLEVLLLDNVKPDTFFHTNSLPRLLRNLTRLRYLDVSNNQLNFLLFPVDTFSSTPGISHVILSQNRFSNIPFDLETTPNLRVLDLSSNAILFLTDHEMLALDRHVSRVDSLTLRLQGNGIACVCSQATFVVWAFTTAVNFDDRVTFTCVTEDVQKVNITDIDDIPEYTRLCQGRYFLMAALILAALMVVVFLTAFLVARFRTSIEALLLGIFVRAFRPMRPEDYRIQVFTGYADENVGFVRGILLRYLEGDLRQTTYVHQRDMVGGYTDEQFYEAISNSWRVLLVLSSSFLTSYNKAHTVMQYASHSVTAVNQNRVFVLLEETQVHAIPDYLLGILDDTRIILLPDLQHDLTYQQKQMIWECLRAPQ